MPSLVAWAAMLIGPVLIESILALPLKLLQASVPLPGLFVLLRVPYAKMAALIMLAGAAVQTAVSVEEVLMDKIGGALNSAAKSSSPPSTASLAPLRQQLSDAEEQLARLSTFDYPASVFALLDQALALPSTEGSDIEFTAADIQEWEDQNRVFRLEFDRLVTQAAREWVEVLSFDPLSPEKRRPGHLADPHFLADVFAEMHAVQAGRPTKAVYAAEEYGEEQWAHDDAERMRKEQEEKAKQDEAFEAFLDTMFEKAQRPAGPAEEAVGADAEAEGDEQDSDLSADAPQHKRARSLLEQPQNPALPPSPSNPTWRETLRSQYDLMHDPAKGGVLGEAMQSLSFLATDKDDNSQEWSPKPLPLMANHLLRSQVLQAIGLTAPATSGWDEVWGVDRQAEEQILPSVLSAVPEAHLTPMQRAVKLDQRARSWATALLSPFLTPPTPLASATRASGSREAVALLRSSPFPSFLRTTEALFALPRSEAHFRIGVSMHEMAFTVFANRGQAERDGKTGVGRVAVEWARRQVEQLYGEVEEKERETKREEL
ncbi:hypothetical protein JCM10213_005415 [Rhodosporidiobolus nylandii]